MIRRTKIETGPTRKFSDKQEKSVVKSLGARQTSNSGATLFDKGDVVLNLESEKVLIECKTKMKLSKQVSIKKEWIDKNREEARFTGSSLQAICFNFGPNEENFYIIDEETFKMFLGSLQ